MIGCLHNKQLFASDLKLDNIFLSCENFSMNLQFYNFKSNWLELRDDPTRSLEKIQNWEHNSNRSAGMQKEESPTPKKREKLWPKSKTDEPVWTIMMVICNRMFQWEYHQFLGSFLSFLYRIIRKQARIQKGLCCCSRCCFTCQHISCSQDIEPGMASGQYLKKHFGNYHDTHPSVQPWASQSALTITFWKTTQKCSSVQIPIWLISRSIQRHEFNINIDNMKDLELWDKSDVHPVEHVKRMIRKHVCSRLESGL